VSGGVGASGQSQVSRQLQATSGRLDEWLALMRRLRSLPISGTTVFGIILISGVPTVTAGVTGVTTSPAYFNRAWLQVNTLLGSASVTGVNGVR
jgi:hypothetical protein